MKKLSFILILLITYVELFGQEDNILTGKVYGIINAQDTIQLEEASIYTKRSATLTNASGDFMLKILEDNINNVKVSIFHWGFELVFDSLMKFQEGYNYVEFYLNGKCDFEKQRAKKDIKNQKIYLLLSGGIVPVYVIGEEKFEEKYSLSYYEFGCTPPAYECILQYNFEIFRYLDRKYGRKWRKEVRQDVVGFKRYIKGKRFKNSKQR